MANEKSRPLSKTEAPDPSDVYERSHPEHESGQGRLDTNKFIPANAPDQMEDAVTHKQETTRQINAEDVVSERNGVETAKEVKK